MAIFKTVLQFLLHPGKSLRKRTLLKQLDECISGKATEKILEVLLELMSIMFLIDKSYRKNIIGFNGKYRIQDQTGAVDVSFQYRSEFQRSGIHLFFSVFRKPRHSELCSAQ